MENKKKILIVNNNMRIGGVQKSLVNLLHAIHDQYDITLLLFSATGAYMTDIPQDVHVLCVKSHYKYLGVSMSDVRGHFGRLIGRSFYAVIARVFGRKYAAAIMNFSQKKITGYDVAISYLQNAKSKRFYGGCMDFVRNCVDAPMKAVFLHCDYIKSGANTPENARLYAAFDVIAACSDGCRRIFEHAVPELKEKTTTVRNCHEFASIRSLAQQDTVAMDAAYINIVTVARLSSEKGVMRAIDAIFSLGERKEKIRYFIVGDGQQRAEIEQKIMQLQLSHVVTLCGSMPNPYGYMKAADLLLIPSFEEAAPMVIDEAASLGTPVLSTMTSSAEDMVAKRGLGWVCENSLEGILSALNRLLECPQTIAEKKQQLSSITFNNDEAVKQFNEMIG